jgi:hypothetical protein
MNNKNLKIILKNQLNMIFFGPWANKVCGHKTKFKLEKKLPKNFNQITTF